MFKNKQYIKALTLCKNEQINPQQIGLVIKITPEAGPIVSSTKIKIMRLDDLKCIEVVEHQHSVSMTTFLTMNLMTKEESYDLPDCTKIGDIVVIKSKQSTSKDYFEISRNISHEMMIESFKNAKNKVFGNLADKQNTKQKTE